MDNDIYQLIPNINGDLKFPFMLAFDDNGRPLVGREAKLFNQRVISNLHDIAGKRFDQIVLMEGYPFNYEIHSKYNKPFVRIKLKNQTLELSIEEMMSQIFRFVKTNVEIFLHCKASKAALTVPDHFSDSQIMSIKAAANIGGLQIIRCVKHSIAAIHAYELHNVEEELNALIVDVDEESTNLVLVLCENHRQEQIGFRRWRNFGQNHFYKSVEDFVLSNYERITGVGLKNEYVIKELRREVAFAWNSFVESNEHEFHWQSFGVGLDGFLEMSRSRFEQSILPSIGSLLEKITTFLKYLELKRSDVSEIILLGSVFYPSKIRKEIRNFFYGHDLKFENGLTDAQALGIAEIGFLERHLPKPFNLVLPDLILLDIGIEVNGGVMDIIIKKGTTVPVQKSKLYTITFNEQSNINVAFVEGDRPLARKNAFLGSLNFSRASTGVRGISLFKVELDVRADGEMLATVTDIEKNTSRRLRMVRDYQKMPYEMRGQRIPRDVELEGNITLSHELRLNTEVVAYELSNHLENKSPILDKIKFPVDRIILKESVAEVIQWFEKHSIMEIENLQQLKINFESNIKPILKRYLG